MIKLDVGSNCLIDIFSYMSGFNFSYLLLDGCLFYCELLLLPVIMVERAIAVTATLIVMGIILLVVVVVIIVVVGEVSVTASQSWNIFKALSFISYSSIDTCWYRGHISISRLQVSCNHIKVFSPCLWLDAPSGYPIGHLNEQINQHFYQLNTQNLKSTSKHGSLL